MRNLFTKYLTQKTAIVIATTGLALVLAAHLLVVKYTYPQAEDLCSFSDGRNGLFNEIDSFYMYLGGGRLSAYYVATLPYYLSTWSGWSHLGSYRALLLLNFALFFIAALRLSRIMLPGESVSANLRTGLAFTTLFLVTNFTTLEGFFWFSGSATYIISLLPCVIVLEFGIKLLGNASLSRLKTFLTEFALVFVGLTHELYSIGLVLFFGSVTFVLLKRKMTLLDSRLQAAVLSLCLAIACFAIIAMAPGTQSRASHSTMLDFSGLLKSIVLGLAATPVLLLESLSVAVLLFVLYVILQHRNHATISQPKGMALVWTALLCTLPVSLILGFFAAGDPLPGRALNLMHFFNIVAVTGLSIVYVQSSSFAKSRWNAQLGTVSSPNKSSLYVFLLLAVVVVFDRDSIKATQIALVEGPKYARAMDDRFARLGGPAADVVLPPLPNDSRLLLFKENEYNPYELCNKCAARYFGKASVRLALPQAQ